MAVRYDRDRASFFEKCRRNGTIPGNDALKLIVLERILEEFELGEVYRKSEVNETIERHFDDAALVRRELVNFGYLRYDNRANEYAVEKLELTEDDIRERSRLERHARDIGLLD